MSDEESFDIDIELGDPVPEPLEDPPSAEIAAELAWLFCDVSDTQVDADPQPTWLDARTAPGKLSWSEVEVAALCSNPGVSGFGEFLVRVGALSREELYLALLLKDHQEMRLGEAAVYLGFLNRRRMLRLLGRYTAVLTRGVEALDDSGEYALPPELTTAA